MAATWIVKKNSRARKGEESLPEKFKSVLAAVIKSLATTGKATGFSNFGPLKQVGTNVYHCHLNSGKPRFVILWTMDKANKTISITYIGTHEKAPY